MFKQFYTDTILIKKPSGEMVEELKASVQNGKKAYFETDKFIEPGDILLRKIGSNFEEYIIIEPGYHDAFHSIPAGYQATIERKNKRSSESNMTTINNYHLSGNNNRINNQSIDNSSNIIQQNDSIKEIFDAIASAKIEIKSSKLTDDEINSSTKLLDLVEEKANDKDKSFMKTLLTALPSAVQTIPSIVKLIEILSK